MIRVIVIGLIAGWITGKLMRGRGYGVLADTALGLIGAVIGGALFKSLGIAPAAHPYGSLALLAMATVGAVILVGITHLFGGHADRLPAP
jgi:uncharacterized membrane protein YeaQ/YmgE (transglycosylase-associated protein family)